jgi:8-oxo-dGTP diphosphatase
MLVPMESIPATPAAIRIAAALVCRSDGSTLLVRKRGTSAFMQPGGKIEPHEQPAAALSRELLEELGLAIAALAVEHLGRFAAPAANEPGRTVEAELFRIEISGEVTPAAEIEEIAWIAPADTHGLELAPLTRDHVLPIWLAQNGAQALR